MVGAYIGERGIPLVIQHARFLRERRIGPADVESTFRQREVSRNDNLQPLGIDVHRAAGLDDVGYALHRHPQAREAAHRPAVQTKVQVFLDAGGIEHGNAAGAQQML